MSSQKHKAAVCQEHDSTSTALNPQCVYRNAGQCHTGKKKKTHYGSKYTVRVQLYTLHVWFNKLEACDMYNTKSRHHRPADHTHCTHDTHSLTSLICALESHFQFGINIHVTMVTEKNPILHCLTFNCSCGWTSFKTVEGTSERQTPPLYAQRKQLHYTVPFLY